MKLVAKQKGFSLIDALIVAFVIMLVGLLGYTVLTRSDSSTQASVANDVVPAPASINTTTDLTAAEKALDATDLSSSTDLTALDNELNTF